MPLPDSPRSPLGPAPLPESEGAQDLVRKLVGTTVAGRYKVIQLLGEGGMGAVFLVEHTVIRKRLALKVLNRDMMRNPEMVARFEREALAAAHIDHPNVVAATDSGRTDDGALFVVLEYIDGKSLRDRLNYGSLSAPVALHIAKQIGSALLRAHGLGIIHRDLKPENIMLVQRDGDSNFVKVLDFGLAKLSISTLLEGEADSPARRSEVLTRYGAVFGTPAYMAPEQAAGGEVDGRTDLYALGVVLYEMLSGVLPFDGDDSAALLRMHVIASVPPLRERAPHIKIPPALESLVMRLLEKKPEKRFENAKQCMDAIDSVIAAEGLKYDPSMKLPSPVSTGKNTAVPRPGSDRPTVVAPEDYEKQSVASFANAETKLDANSDPSSAGALSAALKDLADDGAAAKPATPPATAAKSDGKPDEGGAAPKLRMPSVVDLNLIQPENAPNPALLTPAPPPTIGERVKDAGGEAVGWWRQSGWPTLRSRSQRAWAFTRENVPIYWAKLLDFVRGKLPEKHRQISQTVLGVAVAAILALPVVVLAVLLLSGDSDSPAPAGMPGFASDKEMEKGVDGGAASLEKLAAKYPQDSRIYRALARQHAARKNYAGALRAVGSLSRLDPVMASDDQMLQVVTEAALQPETSDAALTMLESGLGDRGVGALSDLADRTTMDPWRSKFFASLQKGTVRALASEATLILIDLRGAGRCEDKRNLLRRAATQGDARTVSYLQQLQVPTGCGPGGQNDCWPCLRKGTALQATIDQLQKRLAGG
ncbi:MAG TPA: serine/threonine-protein kinase [Pseudomonadota bacterium]|nr:serine/threonine-protein kinase [Pseudomonadota bacterium]